jgi:hypothetical protein
MVSSSGSRRSLAVTVPAGGRVSVQPARFVHGAWVAAAVTLDAGGVGATELVSGPLGTSMTPCASTTSSSWDFAFGTTAGSDALILSLFNPTATAASVDVDLVTASAVLQPPAYQEIQVAPGAVVTESLGDHAQEQAAVATEVVALSGSVVAQQLQLTTAPARSLSVELGAPSTAPVWSVPQSTQTPGGDVVVHVLNPSSRSTVVRVGVSDRQGRSSPVLLPVAARSSVAVSAAAQTRIPHGTPFSLVLRSTNGVGIVVSRQTVAAAGTHPPRLGTVGAVPRGARRWSVPLATPSGIRPTTLAVTAVGARPVRVRVTEQRHGAAAVGNVSFGVVAPGAALVVGLGRAAAAGNALAVDANGPVAVELDAGPAGAPGVLVLPALSVG